MKLHIDCCTTQQYSGLFQGNEIRPDMLTEASPLPLWAFIQWLGRETCRAQGLDIIDEQARYLLLYQVSSKAKGPLSILQKSSVLIECLDEIFSSLTMNGLCHILFEQLALSFSKQCSQTMLTTKVLELSRLYREYHQILLPLGIDRPMLFRKGMDALSSHSSLSAWQHQTIVAHKLHLLPGSRSFSVHLSLHALYTIAQTIQAPSVQILLPNTEGRPALEQALSSVLQALFSFHETNFEENIVPFGQGTSWIENQSEERWQPFTDALFARGSKAKTISSAQNENEAERSSITLLNPRSSLSEATQIALQVQELINSGVQPNRIGIASQSILRQERIARALNEKQIPYQQISLHRDEHPASALPPPLAILLELYQIEANADRGQAKLQNLLQSSYLRDSTIDVIESLPTLPQQASLSTHAEAVLQFGHRLRLLPSSPLDSSIIYATCPMSINPYVERAQKRDHLALNALRDLLTALSQTSLKAALFSTVLGRKDFASLCRHILTRTFSASSSQQNLWKDDKPESSQVFLGDLRLLSSQSYDALFLAGMIRGEFPDELTKDSVLTDEERVILNQSLNYSIFSLRRSEAQSFLLHFVSILSSSKDIFITCPALDEQNRQTTPSVYLAEIQRVTKTKAASTLNFWATPQPKEPGQQLSLQKRIQMEHIRNKWHFSGQTTPLGSNEFVSDGRYVGELSTCADLDFSSIGSSKKPMSISAFEDYSRCPFRFFLGHLLRLEPKEFVTEDLDAMSLGQYHHQVLYQFFEARKNQNRLPLKADSEDFYELDRVMKDIEQSTDFSLLAHKALLSIHLQRLRADLARFISKEASHQERTYLVPTRFEAPFVFSIQPTVLDSLVEPPPSESFFYFRGKIDRIDFSEDQALILDYKLGGVEFYDSVLKHQIGITSFQLPLYALALRKDADLAPQAKNKNISARYYSIRQGRLSTTAIDDHAVSEELLYQQIKRIRRGDFRLAPKTCNGCGFESVCRIKKFR